jgi:transketolase
MFDHINLEFLEKKACQARATCVQIAHDGKVGHLGSALSCVDALIALFYCWLRFSPENPKDPERDRFIMSKGHGCASLYTVMAQRGFFPAKTLAEYGRMDSCLPDHPCRFALPLLECSTGSLGHGLGLATGMLYGLRLKGSSARAVVLMSDGECNEGTVWEAAMFAAAQKLDNLLALVDYNGLQAVGRSDEIMGHTSLEEKFRAFGWSAVTVNGNKIAEILRELNRFPFEPGRPSCIILKTKKGSGISFMEDKVVWHYRIPSDEDLRLALEELGERPLHLCDSSCD